MKSLNIILFLVIIAGCIAVGYGLPREPRIVKETVTNAIYLPFKATPPINLEHMEIKLANQAKALDLATEEYITLQKEYKLLQADLERIKAELEQAKRYGGLVEFRSELELMQWLQQNPVSEREYVKYSYVCSDFARDLVLDAISEGFLMGLSRISDEMHQKAFTIIGKEIYEIEAITDGVRLAGRVH